MPARADRILILSNPRAGSGVGAARLSLLVEALTQRGLQIEELTELSRFSSRAAELESSGQLRTVVAAGGDGTAELVANLTPPETPLTVFPLGTENLLAKYLHLGSEPERVADAIVEGRVVRLDAGRVRDGAGQTRLFLLMMGCGFDADVIHRLHEQRDGNITHLSYAKPILESIRKYRYPALRVTCHASADADAFRTITAHWVFVFNTPSYAIGLTICPHANPFDGHLDITTFRGGSLWQGLKHIATVVLGRQRQSRSVETERAAIFRISSETEVPYQLDGDPGGLLPVEVSVEPQRLSVVVPASWSAGATRVP